MFLLLRWCNRIGYIPGTEKENRPIVFVDEYGVLRWLYIERTDFFCVYFMESNMDFCANIH
jgi:hypothetical protein